MDEQAKRLAIHAVAWNHRRAMEDLLNSLEAQDVAEAQVTVVDNASDDGAASEISSLHPTTIMLRNFRNQGNVRAHNQAIALTLARWEKRDLDRQIIMLTEPGLVFAPDAVRQILAAFDADPELMIAGPKILQASVTASDDGEREFELGEVIESTGTVFKKSRTFFERGRGQADAGQFDGKPDVFGFSSRGIMFRASALKELGEKGIWLDERLPAGQEVLDLVWRGRWSGMKVAFCPTIRLWVIPTLRGRLSDRIKAWYSDVGRTEKRAHQHLMLLSRKNDSLTNRFVHAPWILAGGMKRFALDCLDPKELVGRLAAWKDWFGIMLDAQTLKKKRKVAGKGMRRGFDH